MDAELKTKWLEALRSNRFEQAQMMLRCENKYCCLGVLGVVAGLKMIPVDESEIEWHTFAEGFDSRSRGIYPQLEALGVGGVEQDELATRNDDGATFSEIADWIEQNL